MKTSWKMCTFFNIGKQGSKRAAKCIAKPIVLCVNRYHIDLRVQSFLGCFLVWRLELWEADRGLGFLFLCHFLSFSLSLSLFP